MYAVTINNMYLHDKRKIILFPTVEEAQGFTQSFFQYSMNRMTQEDPMSVMEVIMAQNAVNIEEYKGVGAQTIEFKDLKR